MQSSPDPVAVAGGPPSADAWPRAQAAAWGVNGFALAAPQLRGGLRLLSVVAPVYGCSACLESLVDRIRAAVGSKVTALEIVLVDDASPDSAWDRIVELSRLHADVRGLRLARNFGQHYAIAAGIESARGEAIVVMDCDLQDPPEAIPALLEEWLRSGADAVVAARSDRRDSAAKRLGSYLFSRFLSALTGTQHDHRTANFGIYSRRAIDAVNAMPESDRCFPLMVKWLGLPTALVPVAHAERAEGRSGYTTRQLVRLALNIVLSYSDRPLRMVVRAGLILAAFAAAFAAWSLYRYLDGDIEVAGFTSIIASIWLLGGATVFSIGIVGLYLGRMFNASKQRPVYVISEATDSR